MRYTLRSSRVAEVGEFNSSAAEGAAVLKSESVTFRASAQDVWSYALRVVQEAGYDSLTVNALTSAFSYTGQPGRTFWAQVVRVIVTEVGVEETLVSVQVAPVAIVTFTEGGIQQELLDFILGELEDEFPKVRRRKRRKLRREEMEPHRAAREDEQKLPYAARSSGCLVCALLLTVTSVGSMMVGWKYLP